MQKKILFVCSLLCIIITSLELGYAQTISLVARPISMCCGDFNKDGFKDVAIGLDAGVIEIFLGTRSGTFSDQNVLPVLFNGRPDKMVSADINGDGWLDLIVSDGIKGHIKILINRGDSFVLHDESPSFPSNVIKVGYINDDQYPDIVVAPPSGGIGVFYGNSQINDMRKSSWFHYQIYPIFSDLCTQVALKDVDRDGKLEIFALAGNNVYILDNNEDTLDILDIIQTGSMPSDIKLYDLNHDNLSDIILLNKMSWSCAVYYATNATTFNYNPALYSLPARPSEIVIGDFNYDSYLDIAVLNEAGKEIRFLLNSGLGNLSLSSTILNTGNMPKDLQIEDFNFNGRPDLVYLNSEDNSFRVVLDNEIKNDLGFNPPELDLKVGLNHNPPEDNLSIPVDANNNINIYCNIIPNDSQGAMASVKLTISNLSTQQTTDIDLCQNWPISQLSAANIFSISSFDLFSLMGIGHYSVTAILKFSDASGINHRISDTAEFSLASRPLDYQNPPTLDVHAVKNNGYLRAYVNFYVPDTWVGLPADVYLWNQCAYNSINNSTSCYTQEYTSSGTWYSNEVYHSQNSSCPSLGLIAPFTTQWPITTVRNANLFYFPLSIYPSGNNVTCSVNVRLVIHNWGGIDYTIWKQAHFDPQ